MKNYCIVNQETNEVAQYEGVDLVASSPRLLSLLIHLSPIYNIVNTKKFDTITEYPVVGMKYPCRKGIYIVALNKNEGGRGLLIGLNNKVLRLYLGYWNGEFFNINGVDYHCLNVQSWTFVMDDTRASDFFNVMNKKKK